MADTTGIEWTDATWNPITGCTKVSPGCDHCYAETFAERWRGTPGHPYEQGFDLRLFPDRLTLPLRWRRPRRIFVNSMSDLFHDGVPDDYIAQVFAVMAMAPQHTFQILTKRHARMRSLLSSPDFWLTVGHHGRTIAFQRVAGAYPGAGAMTLAPGSSAHGHWQAAQPLRNVWLGVSVETQQWADIRIPFLLNTPAAVRWISAEPLLGPVHLLNPWLTAGRCEGQHHGRRGDPRCPEHLHHHHHDEGCRRLDWVVTGGESGPGARPAHPDWFRSLRDQCVSAGVAYLHKQNGEWQDGSRLPAGRHDTDHVIVIDGRHEPVTAHFHGGTPATDLARARLRNEPGTASATIISRVGKKGAGRQLDGRTWDQYPNVEEVTP